MSISTLLAAPMRLSPLVHAGLAAVVFGAFQAVKAQLDGSYAASGHPVDYATGQTAFSAERVKGWYAAMEGQGTLDVYVATQMIDFAFIAAIAAMALLWGSGAARLSRPGGWGRKAGLLAAAAGLCGAGCDAAENLVSFVMLADPQGFAGWIALVYSGFAAAKFALLTLAMAALAASLLLAAAGRIARRPALG